MAIGKKIKRGLIGLLSVIALLLLFVNILLNSPPVQTCLTYLISSSFSAKLHAKVTIGRVEFEFLKKLVLKNVFVEDQHKDTLLYAEDIKLDIAGISFDKHQINASNLILDNTRFKVVTYKNEEYPNLQFLLDFFASKDTVKKAPGPKWDLKVGGLTLNNVYFSFRNQRYATNDSLKTTGFNVADMKIHNIYGHFTDILFEGDTLRATMEHLAARDESGLTMKDLTCFVKLSSKKMELDAMTLETPKSVVSTDLIFKYQKFPDFFDFLNKVTMYATFRKSTLCFDDLAFFAPDLRGVHNTFSISGDYSGTVSHLKGEHMNIQWGKISSFEGSAELTGLPDIMKTYINVDVDRLVSSKYELELLPRPPFDKENNNIKLPDNFSTLKTFEFNGAFKGYVYDFNANGALSTGIGKIYAVLSMKQDTAHNDMASYKGSLGTESFDLGTFWQNKDLGVVTSSVSISGNGLTRNNADAKLTGNVENFGFKKYNYKDLAVSAELRKGFFSGLLEANDPNLQMDFNGNIDLASAVHSYHFNTYIIKANLEKLNLVHDSISPVSLSTHAEVELKGNNADDLDGTIHIDSTKFAYHKDNYHLKYLNLVSSHKGENHTVSLQSDYADASLSGYFPITKIGECMQNMLSAYLPSVFAAEKHNKAEKTSYHTYSCNVHFNENTGLTNLFIPSLKISKGSELKATYKEATNEVSLSGNMSLVEWAGRKIKDLKLDASGNSSRLNLKTTCDTLFVSDSLYAAAFILNGTTSNDTTHYTIKWNDDSGNYADIPGYIAFPNKTDVYFKFVNPIISLADSVWQADSKNSALIDTTGILVKALEFYHNSQSITIQGKLSKQKNDALVVMFKKLNLQDFNIGTTTQILGTIDGSASVANVYAKHPFFAGSLTFNNLRLNKQYLGDGNVNCYWDNNAQAISLNGQLATTDTKYLSFVGSYFARDTNNLEIDASLQDFPAKIFQPYIKDYSTDFDGSLSGNARIFGTLNKPLFKGDITVNVKKFKFDYLNTYYHSPAINIHISPDTFRIKTSPLLDENRDTAFATGIVTHNHFKNFKLDLNMDATNFMCLNTTESNNSSYYGKAFGTGNVKVYGPLSGITIDASLTTEKGTTFNIPLSGASEIDESDVIRFINKKDTTHKKQQAYKVATGGLQLHFTIKATNDAVAKLIFAEKIGDVMQGTGHGTLQVDMNTSGDFSIRGDYTVEDGIYDFTLKNTISKKFAIEDGGTITWSGDPYNADINLNTVYKLRTSLSPLFPDDTLGQYKKTFPVNCDLGLTGKLTSPKIGFDIELPTVDQDARQTIASYLSSPDEMSRQFFALLVLKSFLPIQERPGGSTSPSADLALGVNSTEFLSDQLSNMLSSISNKFNVGINYQPGTIPNSQELQVMFSTQLFNDRVSITSDVGTVGSTGATQTENTNNIVGEVTVEYKLSKDGKLRVKAFNKANDNTTVTLVNSPYTQGAGLSYRESFNNIGELWDKIKSKFKKNPKKEQNAAGTK